MITFSETKSKKPGSSGIGPVLSKVMRLMTYWDCDIDSHSGSGNKSHLSYGAENKYIIYTGVYGWCSWYCASTKNAIVGMTA